MILLFLLAADLILHNGRILTVDQKFRVAEAVAVEGQRITAVGANREVLKQRGPSTRMVDLKGRNVLPGLIDAHVHVLSAGLSEYRGALPPLDSDAAVQAYIRERMKSTPRGQWIVVPRTFPTRLKEMKMPTRDVLDVATEHPVMFDASYVWIVNSLALKMSGITRDTPNPPGGVIERGPDGEPNGILRNAGRMLKGLNRSESFTEQERLDAMEKQLRRYLDAGLTGVGDRAVGADDVALYEKLKASGKLPVRVALTWRLDSTPPADQLASRIRSSPWRSNAGDSWLKFVTFKVTLDGGMTIGTAYQRMPYGPFGKQLYGVTQSDWRGQLFIEPVKLESVFSAARDMGWQLTAHSQGGGAVDVMMDVFEKLDAVKPLKPTRSHPMHASFQTPEAIARLKKMDLPADVQPAWLYLDGPALSRVFPHGGMKYFFPLKTYREAGIRLAGGSDHMIGFDKNKAVNPYNPFLGMWTAVTRKMITGEVQAPEQRISREDALRMYTDWAAYIQFAEHERGTIETGKLADLVVIDKDYLKCADDQIKDIEPVMVILDGKLVRQ
ncbi:MAG: amidohydrolase [Bryobacterales bacterium]|nr:amidohydrolase [Bryobacterales bacterium]